MSQISKEKNILMKKKTMSYVSRVNKKNTLLKENNNKMLYESEVVKKWVQENNNDSFTYWTKSPYQGKFSGVERNGPEYKTRWNIGVICINQLIGMKIFGRFKQNGMEFITIFRVSLSCVFVQVI